MFTPRYVGPLIAMGACMLAPSAAHAQCPADITDDGMVDTADVVDLILAWGPCSGLCLADLDGNGAVDTVDLIQMISAWGLCPVDTPCLPETILTIEASNAQGSSSMSIPLSDGAWATDIQYIWCLSSGCDAYFPPDNPHVLTDTATGEVIGTLLFARVKVLLGSLVDIEAKVVAGSSDTTFVISTGSIGMDAIDASVAEGSATVSAAVSDQDCDGWAEVIGLGPDGGGMLRAMYNGGTGVFSELLGDLSVDGACWPFMGTGGSADPQSGYRAVGDSVGDMTVELAFEVTSGDWAQTSGKFWVMPEAGVCTD
ncbi:MAG: hypothetical protein ACYTGR_01045 [Planctomycetota bacterium]|jgi:hypothetical protein